MNNKKLHERIVAGIVLVTLSLAVYAAEHGPSRERVLQLVTVRWLAHVQKTTPAL